MGRILYVSYIDENKVTIFITFKIQQYFYLQYYFNIIFQKNKKEENNVKEKIVTENKNIK